MDRDPADLLAHDLALAGVEAGPDFEPQRSDAVRYGAGATNGARWAIESRQEPVASGVDLATPEADKLAAHQAVVTVEQIVPAPVAEACRLLGRADNVGEQHGREHAIGLGVM